MSSCETINWFVYFHYDTPFIEHAESDVTTPVKAETRNCVELESAVVDARGTGLDNLLWDTLVLETHASLASHYFINAESWDAFKRGVVRDVLQETRRSYDDSPPPWCVNQVHKYLITSCPLYTQDDNQKSFYLLINMMCLHIASIFETQSWWRKSLMWSTARNVVFAVR